MNKRLSLMVTVITLVTLSAVAAAANPVLSVELSGHGSWVFTQPTSGLVVLELAADIPISFTWSGDASAYGGEVVGYRYGWDLVDPGDPNDPGWTSAGFVPDLQVSSPMTFSSGIHRLHIVSMDDAGSTTEAGFHLVIVESVSNRTSTWSALKRRF